jgi:uncharacterized membrane protein
MGFPLGVGAFDVGSGGLFGHGFALMFIFIVSLVLLFLLGFAIRDALQKRGLRLRAMKKPETVARR